MRVLLVSPFSERVVGGIVSWTKYITNYHRKHGDNIDLRLLNNANITADAGKGNLFHRLKSGLKNYLPVLKQFKRIVTREKCDVAHICTSAQLGLIRDLLIVRAAKKNGIKTCVHFHFGRIPQVLETKGWERRLLCRLLRQIDCAVVMDETSLDALRSHGYHNIAYLPNPLSTEVQQLIKACDELQREHRRIVYAGHVIPTKGVCELVEACKDIPNVRLELLGKCSDTVFRDTLYGIAGEGASRWLSIPGNKPLKEVIEAMKSCSVFALPSYTEGFPNVILEGMACECPIVATPVGAIPEMLAIDSDKPCGVCIPIQDVKSLRRALVELLDNPDKAAALGQNARSRVYAEYEISKVWQQLVVLWGGDNNSQ